MNHSLLTQKHQELKCLMQTYFDVAQEVLFSLNEEFCFTSVNAYAETHLEQPIDDILKTPFYQLAETEEEQLFLQERLVRFQHAKQQHLQFSMSWTSPAGKQFEIAVQLSKYQHGFIGSGKDLTNTLLAVSELYETQSNFETLIEHNLFGILITDQSGNVMFANQAAANILHQTLEELMGFPIGIIQPMAAGEKFEIDFLRPNLPPGRAEISSMQTTWRELPANLVIMNDITDLFEARKHIERMAYLDSLTQLPNRSFFMTMLNKTISRYERNQKKFALFFMDLNAFKSINDNYGHTTGDTLLAQVSERLRTTFRNEDLIARMGGDEFTAIIEDINSITDLKNLALKINHQLLKPIPINSHSVMASMSIGIAIFPDDSRHAETLLSQADAAMYAAKKQNTTHYSFFQPNMLIMSQSEMEQKSRLFNALTNQEFRLFYQPQMNLLSHEIEGYEALIRWEQPESGIIPPDEFIPLLEQTGLITDVGYWVIDTALKQLETWQANGKPLRKISVNVSPIQLYETDFVHNVIQRVKHSNISPKFLALEITESVFISSMIHTRQMILELQRAGFEVHMDDFGSGYSSFNELKHLPFDVIKIDRGFIQHLDHDPRDVILVETMIRALHGLEKRVIAEGIENEAQMQLLKQLGCDMIQGYFLSKPLPIDQLDPKYL